MGELTFARTRGHGDWWWISLLRAVKNPENDPFGVDLESTLQVARLPYSYWRA